MSGHVNIAQECSVRLPDTVLMCKRSRDLGRSVSLSISIIAPFPLFIYVCMDARESQTRKPECWHTLFCPLCIMVSISVSDIVLSLDEKMKLAPCRIISRVSPLASFTLESTSRPKDETTEIIAMSIFLTHSNKLKLTLQGQNFAASCENPFGFLQQNFAEICGFSSIDIVCCTLRFTRIYLDSHKLAGENLCKNRLSDSPRISASALELNMVLHSYSVISNNGWWCHGWWR